MTITKTGTLNSDYHCNTSEEALMGTTQSTFDLQLTNSLLASQIIENNRSFFSRWFGVLKSGSLRGSIFTLMSSAIGAGVLSLPYVNTESGIIVATFNLIFGAIIAYWAMIILMKAGTLTKKDNYAEIIEDILGPKVGIILHVVLILLTFGAMVIYFITSANFMPEILKNFGMETSQADSPITRIFVIIAMASFVFPIMLQRKLSGFQYFSLLGVIAIIYILIVVVIETPSFMINNFEIENICWFKLSLNTFQGYAIAVLAYTSHMNIFIIRKELQNSTEKRMKKIFIRAVVFEMIIYLTASLSGYFSFLKNTPSLIITRPSLPGSKDTAMLIGQIALFINMMSSVPLLQAPCREQIFSFLGVKRKTKQWEHVFSTFLITLTSVLVAIGFPDVYSFFAFLGGLCAVCIVILFPLWIQVKLSKKKWYSLQNLATILLNIILSLSGFTAAVISLLVAFDVMEFQNTC